MKLSDIIKKIQQQIDNEGDLEVNSYKIDDEQGISEFKKNKAKEVEICKEYSRRDENKGT